MTDIVQREVWDTDAEKLVVVRKQDVSQLLTRNKEEANDFRYNPKGTFHKVASVPMSIIEQWMKEGINPYRREDWEKIRQKLNGEYKLLKTTPWRI